MKILFKKDRKVLYFIKNWLEQISNLNLYKPKRNYCQKIKNIQNFYLQLEKFILIHIQIIIFMTMIIVIIIN